MKVTVKFEDGELDGLVQTHLDGGPSIQEQLRKAVRVWLVIKEVQKDGKQVFGHGDASRFRQYNTVIDIDAI